MHKLRLTLILTSIYASAPASHAKRLHSSITCSDLDGAAFDDCVRHEAEAATANLTSAINNLKAVTDRACFSIPEYAIGSCLDQAQQRADQSLQASLKNAAAYIDSETSSKHEAEVWKKRLDAAQRSWVTFRDMDCSELIDSEYQHGTGSGAAEAQCRLRKTLLRFEDLRARYRDR